ncbi:CRISPR-associated helicase Cas3 [Gordonia polyisoprenivorans VH2]|uniref:CRISPR-associated helicase Cas3 n=1 Tax=Gordonia polyisoprenivorans (strain DSM 44266 / VH2) TaxID=1112204 RepID=H6N105_GORPV|nr:CRISPR-associated helicase/endonuclease Cas3 [Gordonia polyisoprenivorans]AFA74568.1 CRISPR-associated helicase Cas3 [Gordonia polyisoprenivorans VH2]
MLQFESFDDFFREATGRQPYPYQVRVATDGAKLPDVIDVPPGLGKTAAIVLGWLWRYLNDETGQVSRRLVLALPMRTLTRQSMLVIPQWIHELGLKDAIDVVQLVGGIGANGHGWRRSPGKPQIIVGTVDMIVSRMLMRGYGSSRGVYPIDAGLLWNDTHLVVDETQLAPASTVTARQIAAFQRESAALNVGLTCMSATVDENLLNTVNNPLTPEANVLRLTNEDLTPEVRQRLDAERVVRELSIAQANPKAIAEAVAAHHRRGLTLVIVNTVATAVDVYKRLAGNKPPLGETRVILLHSRFRPVDRDGKLDELQHLDNAVVVSTQVIEAGVDLDARTLITEAAPWPSLIQRSGRCNRAGITDDAELWWFASGKRSPYELEDVEATAGALRELEGQAVTNARLLDLADEVKTSAPAIQVLRRSDFHALFDTSPDLSGNDPDISPFIRDADDPDVQIAWVDFVGTSRPSQDLRLPEHDHRCRARIGDVRDLLSAGKPLWFFDVAQPAWSDARWSELKTSMPIRPGQVFVIDAEKGGYTTGFGLDPKSSAPVPVLADAPADGPQGAEEPGSDGNTSDSGAIGFGDWLELDQHLREAEDQAKSIVNALDLAAELRADIVLAARLHDIGKAHPLWQNALQRTVEVPESGKVWAKSPGRGRLVYADDVKSFRHELASVALLDAEYADLLEPARDRDLVRYLIAAHHGKVRVQVRDDSGDAKRVLGLSPGEVIIPRLLDVETRTATIKLEPFKAVSDTAEVWADMVHRLLGQYGPFRLAYFEALVRIADWNASALHEGQASA